MNEQQFAQEQHEALAAMGAAAMREARSAGFSEDVIVRGTMMGATSYAAALWVTSARISGISMAETRSTFLAAANRFFAEMAVKEATAG